MVERLCGRQMPVRAGWPKSAGIIVSLTVVLAILAGCSTGSLAIRYLYGRFDNTLNDRILAYAEFTKSQEAEIRRAVDDYVSWHRRSELPKYAHFLGEISAQLKTGEFDEDAVVARLEQARSYSDYGFERSPIVNAGDFLRNLSDAQVAQIAETFSDREASYRERRAERDREGEAGRLNRLVKNIERLGVKLTGAQRLIIADGIKRYRWQPGERRRIWRSWEKDFLGLLARREQPGFTEDAATHLARYQKLARIADPARDAWNQRNTARTIHDVLRSFDDKQTEALVRRLSDTRRTLLAMSSDS